MLSKGGKLGSSNPGAYNHIGALFILVEKYEEAKPFVLKAIELNQDFASAHANMGVCCHYTSDDTGALKYLDKR